MRRTLPVALMLVMSACLSACSSAQHRSTGVDPCSLVSAPQVSAAFPVTFRSGRSNVGTGDGYDTCRWQPTDKANPVAVELRIASDHSLATTNAGFYATSVPPCRAGCPQDAKQPALSAARAYRSDFAVNPTRWLVVPVLGLGTQAKVAWIEPAPGTSPPTPKIAAGMLGTAQLDVLSGPWLITMTYVGPVAQSPDVSPALQDLARRALQDLPPGGRP